MLSEVSRRRIRSAQRAKVSFRHSGSRMFYESPWLAILSVSLCFLFGPAAEGQGNTKNVLFLFSAVKYSDEQLSVMEPSIRAHAPFQINFYHAYLDDPQVEERSYRESVAATLYRRYADVKIDVLIASNPAAVRFAREYRDKLFPGAPIFFVGIAESELEVTKGPGVTGVADRFGFRETIELALRLQPDTRTVAVMAGLTRWDAFQLATLHSELLPFQNKVKEIDLVGAPDHQMLERVAALPPHSVVLFQVYPQFSSDPDFGTWDLLTATAHRVPTYSTFLRLCINGCIGGPTYDYKGSWMLAAEMAARVLSGVRVEDIPVVHNTRLQSQVDWRALQRWHIPESALPPGSVVLNREPSLWERDRKYFLPGIAIIVLQASLIIGLLWQRARKHRAEAMLRESEGRFRLVANNAPVLIWMSDEDKLCTYFNDAWLEFTGRPFEAECGNGWVEGVHPDDLQKCLETYTQCFDQRNPFRMEYRLRRHDGVYCWIMDLGTPRFNADGSFAGYIGSAIDVTDQKLAHEALQKVSGQLIEAQEKERRHIARELHDDICQELALLSVDLQQAGGGLNGSSPETKEQLEEMYKHCSKIALDVQSLSHQLHSSKLDYLGLTSAVRGFCRDLATKNKLSIDFKDNNVPSHLPTDISLCLFRVTQEAVHNAVKYSGTKQVEVKLNGSADHVQLVVSDAGAGFDVEEASKGQGLGLVSMKERVNLVDGRFHIKSKPGEGTIIVAVVPLIAEYGRSASNSTSQGAA